MKCPRTLLALILLVLSAPFLVLFAAPPPGYYLVWADEFNGSSLDTSKWSYRFLGPYRDAVNTQNAVSFSGSNLVITTYTEGGTNYTAMLSGANKFNSRYGYWETRLKWSDSNAVWSAFWLLGPRMWTVNGGPVVPTDPSVSGLEVDICEHRYADSRDKVIDGQLQVALHYFIDSDKQLHLSSGQLGSVQDAGYHTYGFLWTSSAYQFSIDDSPVYPDCPAPVSHTTEYPLLSSAVDQTSTTWAGHIPPGGYGSQTTSLTKLSVDYVRYYAPTNVRFWTGANSVYWTNSANWISNQLPTPTSDLTFSYLSSANRTMTLGQNFTVHGLVFLDSPGAFTVNGANTLTLGAGGVDMIAANRDIILNAPINLAADQTWAVGPNHPGDTLTVNASLSGSAALTKASYGTLVLKGANAFSGTLYVDTGSSVTNDGALQISASSAVANVSSPIWLRNTGTGQSTFQLDGSSGSVAVLQNVSLAGRDTSALGIENISGSNFLAGGLTLAGGGSAYTLKSEAGTLHLGGTISAGASAASARTLTLKGNGDFYLSGSIQNGSASALSVTKSGSGALTLSGPNTYTGDTTVSGGTLAGSGSVAGSGTIRSGATLAPGSASVLGRITFGGALTLAPGSTNFMHLNKASQTNDLVLAAGALTYDGTLVVTNLAGTLAPGDSFKLFNADSYSGTFARLILPALPGWNWSTNGLTNGILTVVATPQITSDLPAQVTVVAGNRYTYSVDVNASPPFSFQWYNGTTPLPGQTNATFTLTAETPGSTTCRVVVTNLYGTAASTVSTVTVIPQLTNYYASHVLAYGPVGYWPLQETNPPALVTRETNYGTLGPLGDAYYALKAGPSPRVSFGQPGALAPSGDDDQAVAFTGPSGTNYAFVPHSTPALTVRPPFTAEAWVNSSYTSYADILGQGGSGLNAPPNSGNAGGFRLYYGGSSSGAANLALYLYTGSGTTRPNVGTSGNPMAPNQWHHCVATYDGANVVVYVDGQPLATGTLTMAPDTWSPLTIGDGMWLTASTGPNRPFYGSIDEVALYTNVLSPDRVLAHFTTAKNLTSSNYMQSVLADRPLLYYRMNGQGYLPPNPGLYPSALNFGSASVHGNYPAGTRPGGLAGPPLVAWGSALVAPPGNGIISCVDAGCHPAFNPTGTQPFSVLAWFRTYPSDGRVQALMSHGAKTSWALNLVGTSGTVAWSSGAGSVNSTTVLNDGNWHHAAGVYDGARNYLYVDGALNNSATATGSVAGNRNEVLLGGDPDYTVVGGNQRYFAGAIAQAAFFTNALTLGQVQAIYQAGVAPPPPWLTILNLGANQVQLNWNYGTLQRAPNASGPFSDLPDASPPCTLPAAHVHSFYRVRL